VPEAVPALSEEIGGRFRYEGEVTSASSPISDLLREGGGVCQDFAHLLIASCRFLGFAARYVSGYVMPANGADATASHAWCEVYDPGRGWLGVDPTHGEKAGERHVIMGVGRDYHDVPPNRGIFRGQADETMHVRVELKPITRDELGLKALSMFPLSRQNGRITRQLRRVDGASILEQLQQAQQQQQ
jgi:transglutaminase-like putative cysteine protease